MVVRDYIKPGTSEEATLVDIEQALLDNPYEEAIISKLGDEGFALAGSASLALEGTVYRPKENPLHDIDFSAVEVGDKKEIENRLHKIFPNIHHIRDIDNNDGKATHTYLTLDRPFTIRGGKEPFVYDLIDENGNTIGWYKGSDLHMNDGVKGKFLDFFAGKENGGYPSKVTTLNGKQYKIADARNAMQAKVDWQREKDIWDFNRWIPYNAKKNSTDKAMSEEQANKAMLEGAKQDLKNGDVGKALIKVMNVFHGSTVRFKNFDHSFMGTGEGA